jgi:membrane protein implicated in regulation of membrane protease activity
MSESVTIISWLILAGSAFIGEMMIPQFFLFWFGIGAIAALVSYFLGLAYALQWVVFAIVSGVGLFSTRLFAKSVLKGEPRKSAVYELLGQKMKVTETIDNINGKGQVQGGGDLWRAKSEDGSIINEGSLAKVIKIEGTSLVVKLVDSKQNNGED